MATKTKHGKSNVRMLDEIDRYPQQPDCVPVDAVYFELRAAYRYRTLCLKEIEIPRGRRSDLLSAPRVSWTLLGMPPDGDYRDAAYIHDELYRNMGRIKLANGVIWKYTRAEADAILREIMLRRGIVPRWKIHAVWLAVRLFGGGHWNKR